ncbi:MAG: hypothetical protein QOC92_3209, partial [Acidimicrobiaceae bacterium]
MKRKVFAAIGSLGVGSLVAFAPMFPSASAADAQISGFDDFGFSAPISILVYEPFFPVPTSPQGEMRYSYSDATLQSGPFGAATASTVYPGATVATGLPAFDPRLPNYPIITTATYPPDPTHPAASQKYGQMSASASPTKVVGSAQTAASATGGAVSFGQAASTTTATMAPSKVTTTSVATIDDLGLMASIIEVKSIHSEVQ